jgi:hypothetical protein
MFYQMIENFNLCWKDVEEEEEEKVKIILID